MKRFDYLNTIVTDHTYDIEQFERYKQSVHQSISEDGGWESVSDIRTYARIAFLIVRAEEVR